jgi:YidC/Oxa1 family membrane protein insertase
MDKNTLIGLFLIGAILLTFTVMNNDEEEQKSTSEKSKTEEVSKKAIVADTTTQLSLATVVPNDSLIIAEIADSLKMDSVYVANYVDSVKNAAIENSKNYASVQLEKDFGIFASSAVEQAKNYTILENDKIALKISNKGGQIVDVKLKEYQSYADYIATPDSMSGLHLFDESLSSFGVSMVNNGIPFSTENLFFETVGAENISLEADSNVLTYRLHTNDPSKYIDFKYALKKGKYDVDFDIEYVNLKNIDDIDYSNSHIKWQMTALATEKLASDERTIATTMFRYFDQKRDYISERASDEEELTSSTNWVAFKHKFFSSIIISETGFLKGKVSQKQLEGDLHTLEYKASLQLPATSIIKTKFFFGPNENDLLLSYDNGMDDIINHGWGIFGWVNKYFIQPVFELLRGWGLAMGLIIFLVTLIVKIVITPLTYKNYISSAKMKVLKPEITRINEKFAGQENMMKRQQETQALYRSSGVNPMAGCIPMLIQMPILLAVFRFFPSSIHLRHASFLWAEDLSSYDAIASWTGDIPILTSIYGNHISLFTLLMAVSTLIYTVMNSGNMAQPSTPGMPNMKIIMYFFPIMMIFFFNSFSAGLSYYYLCGNLFNIGIMFAIKKFFIDEDKIREKIEDNKKKPAKKSKFMQRLEEVQKQQIQQKKK